ncbi:hypothetical protein LINPERPRIM_LOCUS25865 [Linum perenne]
MTSPDIQKDIVHALALETSKLITKDIGDDFFAILADESRDVSVKEQMGVVLRYVDGKGDTKAISLKKAIESMLVKHGLSISKVRGQGYDGASNMKGELNGLNFGRKSIYILYSLFCASTSVSSCCCCSES